MTHSNKKIITRFAPSPTGFMHVGNVRTALYSYLMARKHGGTFILRIEDTDKEREVEGSITHIIESLQWLGITWDEGPGVGGSHEPYIQSERLDIYKKYAQKLIQKGCAYPDPYTEEEVEKMRQKAEEEKRPFLFREHRPTQEDVWDGTRPLRFKVNTIKRYEWHDLVYGDLSAGEEALDDFVLIKSDGYPTYNFAHIVDDIEMGVTHVMRGQEFIASTPKFLSVYDALEALPPLFATLPHIMASDGKKKLGKRDGAKDILEYRNEGYLPETMFNFLAFLGWNPGDDREILSKDELIRDFDITRVGKSGAQFNDEKLNWMNREYLKKIPYEEQEEYIASFLQDTTKNMPTYGPTILHALVPIIMERIYTGQDIRMMEQSGDLEYFFKAPTTTKDSLFFKSSKIPTEGKYATLASYLEEVIVLLGKLSQDNFTKDTVKEAVWPYAEQIGRGDILWPVRYALSGKEKSPDPFILAEVLGQKETISRIELAVQILRNS
ncbi:MAG: glutamate--tRNA ligase [Candidatus Paceibacterota bacterium]